MHIRSACRPARSEYSPLVASKWPVVSLKGNKWHPREQVTNNRCVHTHTHNNNNTISSIPYLAKIIFVAIQPVRRAACPYRSPVPPRAVASFSFPYDPPILLRPSRRRRRHRRLRPPHRPRSVRARRACAPPAPPARTNATRCATPTGNPTRAGPRRFSALPIAW
jgi:hypothetical protein